ncbi:hypothetical protein NQ152_14810 [Microbacterium sp. zg.B48]|uniref:hypothetical protein n=1 Tax=unclassified Microbacterium TaxID=2609290 RepID=UPI00214C0FCA|nr:MULTISPECIES: hypothetical protein [unclassified Microbacterium]MCR2764781.1 hypothetical protein [Microbacterium sp. zg.B48]MCR2810081.1 hypothetical protein [Microbacterium sp. zg.B185]WIM20081.1 hypothetical protein QNO12_04540 [Microbacterium sp. zg-B185]
MPRPSELPDDLRDRGFSFAEAIAAGVTPQRLRAADLSAPFHGIRIAVTADQDAPPSLRHQCEVIAPRLRDFQFFSHETALALVGAPLPRWPHRPGIHVSAHRPAREPRTRGVVGHRLQTRESAVTLVDGLPVEHPVRAWRQAGIAWAIDDLIAAADFLIARRRPLATIDELREEVRTMGDVSGRMLARALREVRAGAESPEETRLRLVLTRNGLPEPELNWELRDDRGRLIARLDLAYPALRVGVEYDGRVHADDPRQFEADADRWSAIARAGWTHVRILRHHMRGRPPRAVDMVRDALYAAGWARPRGG